MGFKVDGMKLDGNKFLKIAQRATTISPLMDGREKLDTDSVAAVGEPVTINAFDLTTDSEGERFGIYTVVEYPEHFLFAGKILTEIFTAWAEEFDGDIETASQMLWEEGGVKMTLKKQPTKDGKRTVTVPTFVE